MLFPLVGPHDVFSLGEEQLAFYDVAPHFLEYLVARRVRRFELA
jgi:hypothetical protein